MNGSIYHGQKSKVIYILASFIINFQIPLIVLPFQIDKFIRI